MKKWYKDYGLQARMLLTMFLLAALYLFFLAILATYGGVGTSGLMFIAAIMLFIQFFFSDKLALWSMGGRIVTEQEEPRLHETISRLCAIADLPKPKVAIVDSNIPNAFATGKSKGSAVVAVTTSLKQRLSQPELEAVLAHELSHVKNRDMLVITIASFLSTVAALLARSIMFFGMGGRDRDRNGGAAIVIFVVSIAVWIISYLLIQALSRYREFAADRGSAIITGHPAHLASALMNISGIMEKVPSRDLREVQGMNAFFIIPAISGDSIMNLFSTHPTVQARIRALEEIERNMEF
ncbi:MAG: zinc metalloprotease HtpX [Candidatus Methanoperedens sp.]|nr:zinc metalloprotease HtpX [Candidatus Methanoperedens sp.]MCE8426143.1 zinc metalloprotease HtpX [Candidatus Methanoperedens sp.]MCE8428273.1 zinc metalloprotease HtpX [Candidatus Methanoperedens sp.]